MWKYIQTLVLHAETQAQEMNPWGSVSTTAIQNSSI